MSSVQSIRCISRAFVQTAGVTRPPGPPAQPPATAVARLLAATWLGAMLAAQAASADCECRIDDYLVARWAAPDSRERTYAVVVALEPWSWNDALARARTLGATLASTPTAGATGFAAALARSTRAPSGVFDCAGPWLGASRPSGTPTAADGWTWISGAPFAPTAWIGGAPTRSRLLEAAVVLADAPDGGWIDALPGPDAGASTRSAIFVWETFADCNANGEPDALEIARNAALDADGDGALDGCATPDLNGDGQVDAADLAALLAAFGSTGPAGDLDGSGSVDAVDLSILLNAWG